jgi:integrase/recombinase XerD
MVEMLAEVQNIGVNNVYTDIMTVLNDYKDETKKEYYRCVTEFFKFYHGKEINEMTKDEVEFITDGTIKEKITLKHTTKYRNHLKKKHPEAPATVNKKMAGLKTVYKKLQGYGYDVEHIAFAVKPLKVNFKSYGVLSVEQVKVMAELALEEKFHGFEKHLYILLAAITSVRVDALLSATWADIKFNKKTDFYNVKVLDKGDEYSVSPFEKDLYEKLIQLKTENTVNTDKVFVNLTVDSVNDCVKRLAEKMGIPKEDRITTHSLRKVGACYELESSGDVYMAARQTGHRSIQVLVDHYTDKNVDQGRLAGIRMMKSFDEAVFSLVDKDELLKLLKEHDPNAYRKLGLTIQDMIDA